MQKQAAILFDAHLGYHELWFQGRPLVHSRLRGRVQDWANENGYVVVT